MPRLIDADALLKKVMPKNSEAQFRCVNVNDIINAPTVKAQPEPQWIPCSERLPKESGRYLVTRGLNACGSLWSRIYIANYSDLMGIKSERIWWQGNVGKSDFERLDDVLAWKPLEEPWRGDEE